MTFTEGRARSRCAMPSRRRPKRCLSRRFSISKMSTARSARCALSSRWKTWAASGAACGSRHIRARWRRFADHVLEITPQRASWSTLQMKPKMAAYFSPSSLAIASRWPEISVDAAAMAFSSRSSSSVHRVACATNAAEGMRNPSLRHDQPAFRQYGDAGREAQRFAPAAYASVCLCLCGDRPHFPFFGR